MQTTAQAGRYELLTVTGRITGLLARRRSRRSTTTAGPAFCLIVSAGARRVPLSGGARRPLAAPA